MLLKLQELLAKEAVTSSEQELYNRRYEEYMESHAPAYDDPDGIDPEKYLKMVIDAAYLPIEADKKLAEGDVSDATMRLLNMINNNLNQISAEAHTNIAKEMKKPKET